MTTSNRLSKGQLVAVTIWPFPEPKLGIVTAVRLHGYSIDFNDGDSGYYDAFRVKAVEPAEKKL